MSTFETEQPCGCVVISESRSLVINDVEMRDMVGTIVGITRCQEHQAQWDAGLQRFWDANKFIDVDFAPDRGRGLRGGGFGKP